MPSTYKTEGPWRADVIADSSGIWCTNALRFDTRDAALAYASELASRWMAVSKWRAVPSDTPDREHYVPGSEDGGW